MDELPELRTDEEVDALLARLRAKIAPPAPPVSPSYVSSESSSRALTDLFAAQQEATNTMVRALQVMAEAIDELDAEGPRAERLKGSAPKAKGSGIGSKRGSGAWALGPGASPAARRKERR